MKEKWKRIMSFVLALCLCIGFMPVTARAEHVDSGKCGENVTWKLDDKGTLTISGTGPMKDYGGPVHPWGQYYNLIQTVVIEPGVTSISSFAFEGCGKLSSITIPEGVTDIGGFTFCGCTSLTSVDIPEGITSIGDYAFEFCTGLKSIALPDSVTKICAFAFLHCSSLSSITIPKSVTSIGDGAFSGCCNLSEINIPDGVVSIQGNVFSECSNLTDISIPNSVTTIESYAFYSCTGLTQISIPDGVTRIEVSAFASCDNLKTITFEGNAPTFEEKNYTYMDVFEDVTATVYYPGNNATWTAAVRKNYGGNLTWIPYSIKYYGTRIYGATRYDTAFKAADELKKVLGVSKFQNIIVACGTNFPDALSGTYLAAQKKAPILLTNGSNIRAINAYIRENLAPDGTVYLLGDASVVPNGIGEDDQVKRLGGATRYDTNLLILKEAGVGNKDIIVCTGLNFADSLSASATGLPILLVKDGLYANQKEFLKSNGGNFIIVGGSNAVNATVEKQLKSYGSVKRLAGSNRYDTSVLVAKAFFSKPTSAVLAYAQNFPDGLSGGPLAYALNAPLILTDNNKPTAAVNYATGLGIKSGYVLGGTGLISDNTAKKIFSAKSITVPGEQQSNIVFHEQSVRIDSNRSSGSAIGVNRNNDDVYWVLHVSARYMGYGTDSRSTHNIVTNGTFDGDFGNAWTNAKKGISCTWGYAGSSDKYEEQWEGFAVVLPDDPSFAGRYSATLTFGSIKKNVSFTLTYVGNYTTGTGWSVSDIVWS